MNKKTGALIVTWVVCVLFGALAYIEYINYGFHLWFYIYSFICAVALGLVVATMVKKSKKQMSELDLLEQRLSELKAQQVKENEKAEELQIVVEQEKPLKQINPIYHKRSKLDLRYWRDKWAEKTRSRKVVQINMEHLNGFHSSFLVVESDGGFKFNNKKYVFHIDCKYYNLSSKLWCYDFHENLALPIKRILPAENIRRAMELSQIAEVEYASNPATLERFVTAKIAEGIMAGKAMDEAIKRLLWISIIGAGATIILLLLFIQKTGMLDQATGSLGI